MAKRHTRSLVFLLSAGILLLTSCSRNSTKSFSPSMETGRLEELKKQKAVIDSLYFLHADQLLIYAKLSDTDKPMRMLTDSFPENTESTIAILKGSSNKIITASEFPFSMSGDWTIVLTHYFDSAGKTFAFEMQTNFFNSICTDGVAYETQTKYYNSNFELISSGYELTDENNEVLQKDSCQFPYKYTYTISSDLDAYLQDQKLTIN